MTPGCSGFSHTCRSESSSVSGAVGEPLVLLAGSQAEVDEAELIAEVLHAVFPLQAFRQTTLLLAHVTLGHLTNK